jgi:hypothetical protein
VHGVEDSYLIPIWKISCDPSFWYQLNSEKWRSPQIFKTIPSPPSFLPTYIHGAMFPFDYNLWQGPRSLFKSFGGGWGGGDSTGAIPRRQAGFYPVFFYYPPKKGGDMASQPVPRSLIIVSYNYDKAHFHSGKFIAEIMTFCKMWLADTNFPSENNLEVENFNNNIFEKCSVRRNFSWAEMGLMDIHEWLWKGNTFSNMHR